jgi:hypothetical protein
MVRDAVRGAIEMAVLRFPNRTGQRGVFKDSSPDYIDVDSSYDDITGYTNFDDKSTAETWITDDLVGLLILKNSTNWKIWTAKWDNTNDYLILVTEEDSAGTITADDEVDVYAVPTAGLMQQLLYEPQIVTVSGTTHSTSDLDIGRLHRFTSGSAVTVTLDEDTMVGWHGVLVQEGAGVVTIQRDGSDTINGGSTSVALAQWKSAYVYQPTAGAWVVVA